jgi:hypothetical protein
LLVAFIARDIAGWIGVPVVVVIIAMVVLRRQVTALLSRRKQARAKLAVPPKTPPSEP